MEELSFTFKGLGDKIYNDVPFPYPPFSLINNSFVFQITPKSDFWRFGVRFSKTEDADFFIEQERYANRDLKHVEIAVGECNKQGKWKFPNRLFLQEYYIVKENEGGVLKSWDTYNKVLSPVDLTLRYDSDNSLLRITCSAELCPIYTTELAIADFRYFKIFAWADELNFEIDCKIRSTPIGDTINQSQDTKPDHFYRDIGKAEGILFLEGATNFQFRNDNVKAGLNIENQASVFLKLIQNIADNESGLLLGIFGKWGRGKTFFWKHLVKKLEASKDTRFEHIEFQSWKYQDTPASWAYLYELFVNKFYRTERKIWGLNLPVLNRIILNFKRLGRSSFIIGVIVVVLWFTWYFLVNTKVKFDLLNNLILKFGIPTIIAAVIFYFTHWVRAKDLVRKYFSEVSFKEFLGIQAELHKEFITLLKAWIPENMIGLKRIILFIDDIDRCEEGRIIQVIDSIKIMMDDPAISKRIIVVAAIDEMVLKRAIKHKYYEMVSRDLNLSDKEKGKVFDQLCREYMDKLFINGFKLGNLSNDEKTELFRSLTEEHTFFRNDDKKNEKYDSSNENSTKGESTHTRVETNSKTGKQADSDKKKRIAENYISFLPKEEFEIMDYELIYLLKAIEKFKNATPRSIRIFYYRYLLAKAFKDIFIEKNSEIFDEWNMNQKRKIILPYLIIEYSGDKTHTDLLLEIETHRSSGNAEVTVNCLGESFKLPNTLYLSLLKIVEIVVPY